MAKIKSYKYLIEYKDGSDDILTKEELEECIDDIFDDVAVIIKKFKLDNNLKFVYKMTLFTINENFSSHEYIEHYKNLSKEKYGTNFLGNYDIEIIEMFNSY
jgi:hypothetical protein